MAIIHPGNTAVIVPDANENNATSRLARRHGRPVSANRLAWRRARWRRLALALIPIGGALAIQPVSAAQPNFLIILTDDMTPAMLDHMPRTTRLIRDRAVEFSRAQAQINLCAPSRATLLSGKYAANTGVYTLDSVGPFRDDEPFALGALLQAHGYRTMLAGKYLNGYNDATYVPPGWNDWFAFVRNFSLKIDPIVSDNGIERQLSGWTTELLGSRVLNFINHPDERPFFVYFSVPQPHERHIFPNRHKNLFIGATAARTPDFNEPDVSDKPPHMRWPLMTSSVVRLVDWRWKSALRSLQLVDEQIEILVNALPSETYIIFLSDNGFFYGQHRIPEDKHYMYVGGNSIPMLIAGPGLGRAVLAKLTTPADIAPTIVELADVPVPNAMDGRSLVPILTNPSAPWRRNLPMARRRGSMPFGDGVFTGRYMYMSYDNGEEELYDLKLDPYQLSNRALTQSYSTTRQALRQLTGDLASCAGAGCRAAEDREVP